MRKGDNLTTFIVPKVKKIRSLNLPEPLGPPRPVEGHVYLYLTGSVNKIQKAVNNTGLEFRSGR